MKSLSVTAPSISSRLQWIPEKRRKGTDMQYKRKDRVGDLLKREIAQIVQSQLKDPGLGFVTITGAELSADLKQARIFYSVLGDQDSKQRTASALKRASGFIQNEVGRNLKLKYTPEILFEFDGSVEYGAHIEELIERIHRTESSRGEKDGREQGPDESASEGTDQNE
jgi:ribosome-binding factor A